MKENNVNTRFKLKVTYMVKYAQRQCKIIATNVKDISNHAYTS